MPRNVLFIQGGGAGAHAADAKLVASLRKSLGPSYRVSYPTMPESAPAYASWKARIARALDAMDGPVVLVGHSVGASVLLKYVSEETIDTPIKGIVLVAAPFWGPKGWRHDEFRLAPRVASRLPRGARLFLYHSRDDEEVPFAHLKIYAGKLRRATVRRFNGRGHQFKNDLLEIARDIQSLATSPRAARSRRPSSRRDGSASARRRAAR
jgi:predicted alpha/beta hydrolase family esterase